MYERVQHADQREVVAVVRSQVSAELVSTTLSAHGVLATAVECFGYPSVDFVQGIRVTVPADQVDEARAVLRILGGRDPETID